MRSSAGASVSLFVVAAIVLFRPSPPSHRSPTIVGYDDTLSPSCPFMTFTFDTEWHAGARVAVAASADIVSVAFRADNWRRATSAWRAVVTTSPGGTVRAVASNEATRTLAIVMEKARWHELVTITSATVTAADGMRCSYTFGSVPVHGFRRLATAPLPSPHLPCSWTANKPIAVGFSHMCVVNTTNQMACWGLNGYGQATPPANTFLQVSACDYHTCALTVYGYPLCWGAIYQRYANYSYDNAYPPSGVPMATISAGGLHACATGIDGAVHCWGANDLGQSSPPAGRFLHVSAGFRHTCGVTFPDAQLVCWGSNEYGESTPPAGNRQYTNVMCGNQYTCAVSTTNDAYCWGLDNVNLNFTRVPPGLKFTFVGVSKTGGFSCGLLLNSSAVCWGDPVAYRGLPPNVVWSSLALGQRHTCGTTKGGQVLCYGLGALGPAATAKVNPKASGYCYRPLDATPWTTDGSGSDSWINESYSYGGSASGSGSSSGSGVTVHPIISLNISSYAFKKVEASGNEYACGTDETGRGYCWGSTVLSGNAQTLTGAVDVATSMQQQILCALSLTRKVTCFATLIDGNGQFTGNAFLSPKDDFVKISSKGLHVCGLKGNGNIKCWGFNHDKQLVAPDLSYLYVSAGGFHTCAITTLFEVVCWGRNNVGQVTGAPANTKYRFVTCGYQYTCAIRLNDQVDCWGSNVRGETAAPAGVAFLSIDAGWQHTCGVTTTWALRCWGNNDSGQTAAPAGLFYHVSAGQTHSCATAVTGEMTCWGSKTTKLTLPALLAPFSNVLSGAYVQQLQANNSLTRMTCSTLGWGIALSTNLCTSSAIFAGCPAPTTYTKAVTRCAGLGGRLPTAAEVSAGILAVDTCQSATSPVWTSTACVLSKTTQGYVTVVAAPPSSNPLLPAPPLLACVAATATANPLCVSEKEFNACSLGSRCSQACVPRPASQYACTCEDGFALAGDGYTCSPALSPRSPKTCKQLGWTNTYQYTCSKATNCNTAMTYLAAVQVCASLGARLPRRAEVLGLAGFPSKCGSNAFWTATTCANGAAPGVITTNTATEACSSPTATARVVCVGDPDINECVLGLASCAEVCWNVEGTYTCTCAPGNELLSTGTASCTLLGWPSLLPGANPICSSQAAGGRKKRRLDECPQPMAFADAESFCAATGARLPTLDEIAANLNLLTRGSACGISGGHQLIWSATPCTRDQDPTIGVAATNAQLLSTTAMSTICLPAANATAYPVCVADTVVVGTCNSAGANCSDSCIDMNGGYRCTCSTPGTVLDLEGASCVADVALQSALTAEAFPNPWASPGSGVVAARSYGLTKGDPADVTDCSGPVTFGEATGFCAAAGARLPTADEIANDVAYGSGCQYDYVNVWTSTACFLSGGATGVVMSGGSKLGLQTNPPTCVNPTAATAVVRCVKDPSPDLCATNPCSQVCINQNYGFACACSDGYALQTDGTSCLPAPLPVSKGTCAALSWSRYGVVNTKCTKPLSGCTTQPLVSAQVAAAACTNQRARLPTYTEVQTGVLLASTCGRNRVWTSTACAIFSGAGGSLAFVGTLSLTSAAPAQPQCVDSSVVQTVQCLADAPLDTCASAPCADGQLCVAGDGGRPACMCPPTTNVDATGACVPVSPRSTTSCSRLCWANGGALCTSRRLGPPLAVVPTGASACAWDALRQCIPPQPLAVAQANCSLLGARLPTLAEVRAGLPVPSSSCSGYTNARIWTATSCVDPSSQAVGVVASGLQSWSQTSSPKELCVTSPTAMNLLQCVADALVDPCSTGTNVCSQVCLPDGSSYACACHDGFRLGPDGATCVPELPPLSLASCAQLKWTKAQHNGICASATVNVTYYDASGQPVPPTQPFKSVRLGCVVGRVSYSDAFALCSQLQARLPTMDEIAADDATGAGCSSDYASVWTSTPCRATGDDAPRVVTGAGASRYTSTFPLSCSPTTALATVKCVADIAVQ
uniref:non-specific serine/threonine protein kinase n=1 Tax=Achlya hypogyna TaxID=1202772 RepID=A0A0A7CPH6_ACHHY|nr:secreted protein [Achlya hypogyna]